MKLFLIFFVIAASHDFFNLIPNETIIQYAPDIGLLVLFALLSYQVFLERINLGRLNTFVIWYAFLYLLMVVAQASVASIYFEQSILDGLIVARQQFQYLVVFVLVLYFTGDEDIERFMMALSVLAVFLLILSLINYFGPTIFHHKWAEGHGIRAGIVRAYIPGMEIFVAVAIWQINRFINSPRVDWIALFFILTALFAILFRQTKMHILVTFLVAILMLLQQRRFGILALGTFCLLIASSLATTPTGDNLLFSTFEQAYESVINTSKKSTWSARLDQIERAEDLVSDTFFTGSGGMVLREIEGQWTSELHNARRGMDLGYFVWLKFFGIPGVILMVALTIYVAGMCIRLASDRGTPNRYVVYFVGYEYLAIMISMVTIGYFTTVHAINMLCVCMAILAFKAKQSEK